MGQWCLIFECLQKGERLNKILNKDSLYICKSQFELAGEQNLIEDHFSNKTSLLCLCMTNTREDGALM